MAAKTKKKAVRKAAKRPVKKVTARKTPAKKAKSVAKSPTKPKTKTKKKSLIAKAVSAVSSLIGGKTKAKTPANREYGEGNYKASQRFRAKEEAFVKTNRAKIPALGKAAEDALDGPEGDELRAAEPTTAAHAKA